MLGTNGRAGNPLAAKLLQFMPLSSGEQDFLETLCAREERFRHGQNIFDEGAAPRSAFVVTRGMACRYRLLPDGRRQILSFLIPGDFSELHVFLLEAMDHSVGALMSTRIAAIERDIVVDIATNRPRLGAALWWCAMQEAAMARERIVALGRRNARGRVAYLLCELVWRQRAIQVVEDHTIRLPLTQTDLGDALGLTAVHINRVLQRFRQDRLIKLQQRRLTIADFARLQAIAGLTPAYLQLNSTPVGVIRYIDDLERGRPDRADGPVNES
ncbi:MAG: Crp/Fnr family transcriptional regulator [Stellaceae bacterium]